MVRALVLDSSDDVAVVLSAVQAGGRADLGQHGVLDVVQDIPTGHKIALRSLERGVIVRKYGAPIGVMTEAVAPGGHVHAHNLSSAIPTLHSGPPNGLSIVTDRFERTATFEGYLRSDGRVGTRNYIGILTTVNCSATVARQAAMRLNQSDAVRRHSNIDGVVALTHTSGCCISPIALDLLQRTIAGYATHPNFGGVVVVGLGCETNQLSELAEWIAPQDDRPVATVGIQESGGTATAVAKVIEAVESMIEHVAGQRRQTVSARHLVVGMECGGSDGLSGITANPAMGNAGDLVYDHGGTFLFGETPEIHGAEQLLLRRASDPAVADLLRDRLSWWEEHMARGGVSLDNNPSPGNKEGGITTIFEKSLGAIAKGGRRAPLTQVVEYAAPIVGPGLVFMDTPGYDPVSVTGFVAGGANIICFSTGRGSAFGCKPVPSIKVASNSDVFDRMSGDMDFNAGMIADGLATVDEAGEDLFSMILAVASGALTKSEELGLGDEEFAPWQIGPIV